MEVQDIHKFPGELCPRVHLPGAAFVPGPILFVFMRKQ